MNGAFNVHACMISKPAFFLCCGASIFMRVAPPHIAKREGCHEGIQHRFWLFWAETGGGMDWRVVMALGCGTEVIGHLGLRYEGVGEGRRCGWGLVSGRVGGDVLLCWRKVSWGWNGEDEDGFRRLRQRWGWMVMRCPVSF